MNKLKFYKILITNKMSEFFLKRVGFPLIQSELKSSGFSLRPFRLSCKSSGFSLLEIVISMVIINILMGVIIIAFKFAISIPSKKHMRIATDLAANYLNGILSKEFPINTPCPYYCNHTQTEQSNCITNTKNRDSYNSICDYHQLVDYGARDVDGQIIPGLEKFKVYVQIITDDSVILGNLAGSNTIANLNVIRIDVMVSRKNIPDILISAYRGKHL